MGQDVQDKTELSQGGGLSRKRFANVVGIGRYAPLGFQKSLKPRSMLYMLPSEPLPDHEGDYPYVEGSPHACLLSLGVEREVEPPFPRSPGAVGEEEGAGRL